MQPQDEAETAPANQQLPHQPHQPLSSAPEATPVTPVEATTPVTAPTPPADPAPIAAAPTPGRPVNAGLVVLQWLTYAFWGWTLLALLALATAVYYHFLGGDSSDGFTAYTIAGALVLLPISFVCDFFYSRREPEHKVGAEVLVMTIHAVLFALFGIGALIVSVFSGVQLLISSSSSTGTVAALLSGLTAAVLYGLTFIRTLRPHKLTRFSRWYKWLMLAAVGVFVVLGIAGPVLAERSLRGDRLIESNLPEIQSEISNYSEKNDRLPDELKQLDLSEDGTRLVTDNLVEYIPEGRAPAKAEARYNNRNTAGTDMTVADKTPWRYQLCVTFTKKSSRGYSSPRSKNGNDGYETYLSTYDHPAGRVCYKLETYSY